ncbi:MAG: enoyl-CoA hydratase/isomerase family protein [Actinomycetes bacterium]
MLGNELAETLEAVGLRLDVDGAVARVTLAAPERRNAQTPATWQALAQIGRALPGDVRAVILRAEGPSFCAGLDRRIFAGEPIDGAPSITQMAAMSPPDLENFIETLQAGFTWWRRPDLVTVAAVQGHAVGAGFQLALACDMRVIAGDAQFSMRETSLGLVPDLGGTYPLVEIVGYPRALEICVTGRWVQAAEAASLGLAELVVPNDQLDAAAEDLVAAILAAPRDAVVETKALLLKARANTAGEQLAAERQAQARRLRDLAGAGE